MKYKIGILFKSLSCDHVYKDVTPSSKSEKIKWQCVSCGKTFNSYRPLSDTTSVGCTCGSFTSDNISKLTSAENEIDYALLGNKPEHVQEYYLQNAKAHIQDVIKHVNVNSDKSEKQLTITDSEMKEQYTHGLDDEELFKMSTVVYTDDMFEYRIMDELSGVGLLLIVHLNNQLIYSIVPVSHNMKHRLITQDVTIDKLSTDIKVKFITQDKAHEVLLHWIEVVDH